MLDSVKSYYGETLQKSEDLLTNACCTGAEPPQYIKNLLAQLHDETLTKYYGCGLVVPEDLNGASVLDLGCGAGRDVYLLSAMVGEAGRVVGVDMTDQQLSVARKHQDYHREKFSHTQSNVSFIQGELENLSVLSFTEESLSANSFDVIISNCVINLCTDKAAVLQAAYDLLKPGGEMYFSDVYASRRVPQDLQNDPILYGECLSGAYYWNDFLRAAKDAGFNDPRLVVDSPITVENEALQEKLGAIEFYSATYRLFKIPELESACEDYGQAVIYHGGIPHHEQAFKLDGHHTIEKGKVFSVCGNTEMMLSQTRFAEHFTFIGDRNHHYGIYPGCGHDMPFLRVDNPAACC
ncbi:MAG: arsenite methyltransferase [Flavobacteriales bacterium]|jgi:arsenite methyltransferase